MLGLTRPACGGSEDDLGPFVRRFDTEWWPVLLWPGTTELLLTKLADPCSCGPVPAVSIVPPLEVARVYCYGYPSM